MGVKRKQHSAQFEAQVAMAALSGDKTLAELSSQYVAHQTGISTWRAIVESGVWREVAGTEQEAYRC